MTSPILRNRQSIAARLLADEHTFATTLLTIAVDQYADADNPDNGLSVFSGDEAWHPQTLRMSLEDDFGIELPVINGDKLTTAIDILTADSFFQRTSVFINHCNVLSGSHPAFGEFDPADAFEVAWGLVEGLLIGRTDEEEPFSTEIRYYIGKVVKDEGLKTPPDILRIGLWEPDYGEMPTDPAGFSDAFKMQADESEEIKAWLRGRMLLLATQLDGLPLQHGDTRELVERIRKSLQAA